VSKEIFVSVFYRPFRVVASVCCTRILLNLRAAFFTPSSMTEFEVVQGGWSRRSYRVSSDGGNNTFSLDSEGEDAGPVRRNTGWKWEDAPPRLPTVSVGRYSFQLNIAEEN